MEDSVAVLKFIRVGGLLSSVVVVLVTIVAIRLLDGFVRGLGARVAEYRLRIEQAGTLLRFAIYLLSIAVCVVLSFEFSEQMWLAVGGTIAVTLGFALKDLTSSILAGVTILIDRPFQVGDRVSFNGVYGDIVAIGLRSVRLVTLDDSLVTIPNNKFLTDVVSSGNAGALEMLVQMDFYVGADADVALARRLVEEAIASCPFADLAKPWVVLTTQEIHDGYVAVRLRGKVYVRDVKLEKSMETDVHERLLLAFRRHGVPAPAILHRSVEGGALIAPVAAIRAAGQADIA